MSFRLLLYFELLILLLIKCLTTTNFCTTLFSIPHNEPAPVDELKTFKALYRGYKMLVQVLSIGETSTGKNAQGREWHRRIFQVFVPDSQIAGNIPVYGELDKLNSYKEGGKYEAKTEARAGQNGSIELRITEMTLLKGQPT